MDSPNMLGKNPRRGMSLGFRRSSRSSVQLTKSLGKEQKNNVSTGIAAGHSKTVPHLLREITSSHDSTGADVISRFHNESSGSIDPFNTSFDGVSRPENISQPALPEQTGALPGPTPWRRQLSEKHENSPILQPLGKFNALGTNEDEDLAATQPAFSHILSSVKAYVEVRSGGDNRTRLVMRELRALGATIAETFLKSVTHVVFKDGKLSTYKTAVERQIPMVSTHWIDQCRQEKRMVPEHLFPPYDLENYKNPANHKMIRRVKSFQPDYDMDQEQRLKRILKRKKPRKIIPDSPKHTPLAEEYEIEYNFMQRYIKSKLERHQSPGDCSLVRGLRTLAGPIDPKYNDYINRPVSPTSSEDEMNPIPLAVKLMRRIKSPALPSRSSKKNDYELQGEESLNMIAASIEDDTIEADMAKMFGCTSSDSDSSEIIPTKNGSGPAMPAWSSLPSTTPVNFVSTNPTANTGSSGELPPVKRRKIKETVKDHTLETSDTVASKTTPQPVVSQTQRAVRKLFKAPCLDDSPKLIFPSDSESSQSMSKDKKSVRTKKRKSAKVVSPADMEMTVCVGNAILDDPSSMKTRNARKSERINSRRSSVFFAPAKPKPIKKTKSDTSVAVDDKSLPTIVCTSLCHEEVEVIKSIVKQLGGYEVDDTITRKTTHVVSMNKCDRRTLNILRGIARGCWIVKKDWALKSLEAGKWIAEDHFEWTSFSPAVQLCRFERLAFSPYYRLDFFKECGAIYVSRASKPPRKELCELLCLCGGKVTFKPAAGNVVVGEAGTNQSVAYVTEHWVLDSVQAAALKPTADYAFKA